MNKKVKEAKGELDSMKAKAITDMALAIGIWIGVAYTWGMLQAFKEILPLRAVIASLVSFVIVGVYLLVTGIEMLHWKGKIAKALKSVDPDEANE